jgi:hypothetical protein
MREIASIEGLPPDLVTVDYVKLFCKNSNDVQVGRSWSQISTTQSTILFSRTCKVFNFSSADDEYTSKSINVGALSASLSDDGRHFALRSHGGWCYLLRGSIPVGFAQLWVALFASSSSPRIPG